jgi:hypothetical protein
MPTSALSVGFTNTASDDGTVCSPATDILAPLTASTDLPTHPTISKPFTSQNLTELVSQSAMLMRRENHSLWQVRHLFTAFCGDHTWVPCESMISPNDIELFTDDHVARHLLSLSKPPIATYGASSAAATVNGDGKSENDGARIIAGNEEQDVPMTDGASLDPNRTDVNVEKHAQDQDIGMKDDVENHATTKDSAAVLQNAPEASNNGEARLQNGDSVGQDGSKNHHPEVASNNQELESSHATRAAVSQRAPSLASDDAKQPFIHPMFLPPMHTKTDRNVGLPQQEADDVRKLLSLYVSKQEEVCRGLNKLYNGLNKAQRLRQDVLHWSKAEAHSGPNRDMSDGEDWYDKEEWGLTEDLKKGQDDEEEDTTATTKKTRNRR